ncbi:radical SAM family heme chaperone HemW [Spiroplasma chrysopicola]|uniref:Heme chaperone HemW n=1 Tax=Spiroplasma chrysopicola DF-1 TaxID=1276227 RepID=R4UAF1_9MOLU|nr:radical SAM family heme chaperone HemW [Spiroplasma chrysopicola]AGM24894.1 coproporphyrinogen III oxidase [Spiroplasma chrysopicola DF-1]
MIEHLYVHIPFCNHICFYCDFFKIKKNKEEMVTEYLVTLTAEVAGLDLSKFNLKTIYLGGGTPNSLSDQQLTQLLTILQCFDQTNLEEYSIELNPENITNTQLVILKQYNVNRLSIGVQTFDDKLLKKINRHHNVKDVIDNYHLARKIGFDNISFDLIYNLFDQNQTHIIHDLAVVRELQPDHLSWYSLILKENSYWGKTKTKLPDYDIEFDEIVNTELQKIGYERYEISNYTLNKKYALHNLAYWTNKSFWPLGPGAVGFLNDPKYLLVENSRKYCDWTQQTAQISQTDYYFQILMMGLRLTGGINLTTVKDANEAYQYYLPKISAEISHNRLEVVDNHLRCTPQGYNLLNDILINLLE